MREIKWSRDQKIDIEGIKLIEKKWNIKFPDKYVEIISNHAGGGLKVKNDNGEWKTGIIPIPIWECSDVYLISPTGIDYDNVTCIEARYNFFKDSLPDRIYPFATNSGDDLILFDYRNNETEPAIVFVSFEHSIPKEELSDDDLEEKPLEEWLNDNVHFVCNSFEEMLRIAYPYEY